MSPLQAVSVAEAKIKVADVGCAVHICSLIVQRYSEFSDILLRALQKQFTGGISKVDEKVKLGLVAEALGQIIALLP